MNLILQFLIPQNVGIEIVFFSIILFLTIFTIVSTTVVARQKNWEARWVKSSLDVEHGSVEDISQAVMTWAERIAEIMPGILLVVGLLGTFINLGIALDYASKLLTQPTSATSLGTLHTMTNLLGLLQGLGAKFKTSTWGIIAFLVLRLWASGFSRYDEYRLQWAIKKTKEEMVKKRALEQKSRADDMQSLLQLISVTQENFINKLTEADRGNVAGLQYLANKIEEIDRRKSQNTENYLGSIKSVIETSGKSIVDLKKGLIGMISGIEKASSQMAEGSENVGVASASLKNAVDEFSLKFASVLGNVSATLSSAVNKTSSDASRTLERGSNMLVGATNDISTALTHLSTNMSESMEGVEKSIQRSLKIQENASAEFTLMSTTLNESVESMVNLINKLSDDITKGLRSVSDAGQRMESIGHKLNFLEGLPENSLKLVELTQAQNDTLQDFLFSITKSPEQIVNHLTNNSGG